MSMAAVCTTRGVNVETGTSGSREPGAVLGFSDPLVAVDAAEGVPSVPNPAPPEEVCPGPSSADLEVVGDVAEERTTAAPVAAADDAVLRARRWRPVATPPTRTATVATTAMIFGRFQCMRASRRHFAM